MLKLEPGTLWQKILNRSKYAIDKGALHLISADYQLVQHRNTQFIVRMLVDQGGNDKGCHQQTQSHSSLPGNEVNPFLPFEQNLFVTDLSDTHVCILNKFCIINHHILMITREFEKQDDLLTLQDFKAIWTCMLEFDGMVFYNSGTLAGSSQHHRHIQMIPLPMGAGSLRIPIEPLLKPAVYQDDIGYSTELPFVHAISHINPARLNHIHSAATETLNLYQNMLYALNLHADNGRGAHISSPYNLLITKQWMLLVPRSKEHYDSISINALGFAGALLVRNMQQLRILNEKGPMTALQAVSIPSLKIKT